MEQPEEVLMATLTPEMLDQIIAQDKQEALSVIRACEAIQQRLPTDLKHLNQVIVDLKVSTSKAALESDDSQLTAEEIDLRVGRVVAVLSFILQIPAQADHMVVDEVTRIAIRTLCIAQEASKAKAAIAAQDGEDETKPTDEAVVH